MSRRLRLEVLEDRRVLSMGPLPVPLVAVEPLGSLIYARTVSGDVFASGKGTDRFTVDLDAGQTFAVVVDPDPTLRPAVGLFDAGGVLVGGTTAAGAGEDAVLQPVAITTAGTYTVALAGVDYTHEDLAANMWINPGEIPGDGLDNDGNGYIDDIYGIDAINGDSDPMDDHFHGTHTAGTIGAVGNNGLGVAGVNWNVRIMALKFLGDDGSGPLADAIVCLDYMTMMKTAYGVNVVASNNSWGGGEYSQALRDAIEASNQAGIMFVASAGNSSLDLDVRPYYPSSYDLDGMICVAASLPIRRSPAGG